MQNIKEEKPLVDSSLFSPIGNIHTSSPPKPLKKRFVEYYDDSKKCARNLLEDNKNFQDDKEEAGNVTKQDLMNKVSLYCNILYILFIKIWSKFLSAIKIRYISYFDAKKLLF